MADLTTTGLASIKMGAIANDGGMGATLAIIGSTQEGSVRIETADPTITEFKSEEADLAIYSSSKAGTMTVSFQLGFPDMDQMVAVLGGTKTGTGNAVVWKAPSTFPNLEKSWKLIPTTGYVLNIPRGIIRAKVNGGYLKTDNLKIDVSITVLQPTKSGEPPYFFSLLAAES